jgi:hypothetical protein
VFVFNLFMISVAFLVIVSDQLEKREYLHASPRLHDSLTISYWVMLPFS